jgi:hypothetical protein
MTDRMLDFDVAAPLELFPDEPSVEELDERLVALILCRAARARRDEMERRAQGLPARQLARENDMARRYAAQLGQRGGDIAAAVLALSRPSWQYLPAADGVAAEKTSTSTTESTVPQPTGCEPTVSLTSALFSPVRRPVRPRDSGQITNPEKAA